jgi:hypothetical protein
VIPGWLNEELGLFPGSWVIIHNNDRKFTIISDDARA